MASTRRKRDWFKRLVSNSTKPEIRSGATQHAQNPLSRNDPPEDDKAGYKLLSPLSQSNNTVSAADEGYPPSDEVAANDPKPDPQSQVSSTPEQGSIQPDSPDLWKAALMNLPSDERTLFAEYRTTKTADINAIIAKIVQDVEVKKNSAIERKWTFKIGSSTYNVREEAEKMLAWLERFKQVGDIAVNADPVHAGLPWALFRLLLQAAVSDQEQLGALILGLERISYFLHRCRIYKDIYLGNPDVEMNDIRTILRRFLVSMYTRILQFLSKAVDLASLNTPRRALKAFWRPDDILSFGKDCDVMEDRIQGAIMDFERLLNHKRHTEVAHQLSQSNSQAKGVIDVKNLMIDVLSRSEAVEVIWQTQSGERAGKILTWVSTIANEDQHAVAKASRVKGTGDWIFERKVYKTWSLSEPSMVLWLHGIPGAGKTKLMSRVVDEFLSTSSQDARLAYFYCSQSEESRRKAITVFGSFLKQLGCSDEGKLHKKIVEVYNSREKSGFTSNSLSMDEILSILEHVAHPSGKTTLLLDALDECYFDERAVIIRSCNQLIGKVPGMKILISSRRNDDIRRQLIRKANLGIAAGDNNDDIAMFIKETIKTDEERRRELGLNTIPRDLIFQIVTEITEKGGDMFQWAALQIAQLLQLERTSDIRSNLGRLPVGLKETYNDIIHAVRSQAGSKPVIAMRTFSWLWAVSTTLDIETLLAAVCQDPDDSHVYPVDIDKDYVLGSCQNLITTNSTAHIKEHWAFSHLSVREYFENTGEDSFNRQHCLEMVFSVSINVVLSLCNGPVTPTCQRLYQFAAETWCEQVQALAEYVNSDEKTLARLSQFLGSPVTPSVAWTAWFERARELKVPMFDCKPAFYGCVLGLSSLVQTWIAEQKLDVNEMDGEGIPILCYAIIWNRTAIVDMLLEHGADVNLEGRPLWAALMLAQNRGSFVVLELLLNSGADFKLTHRKSFSIRQDFREYKPFPIAETHNIVEAALALNWETHVSYSVKQAVALLLAYGADCNALLPEYGLHRNLLGRVLFGPVSCERKTRVDLLWSCGAEYEEAWAGDPTTTALIQAVRMKDEFVVEFLIQRGVDINASRDSALYPNALLAAMMPSTENNSRIVQLLLHHGARADAGVTLADAVVLMCPHGKLEYIKIILKMDTATDINIPTKQFKPVTSPLLAAVKWRRWTLIRLLLERGANVNQTVPGSQSGTALLDAVCYNDLRMTAFLVDHGARLSLSEKGFPSPLADAIKRKKFFLYLLLVDHNIREDFPDAIGVNTALEALFRHMQGLPVLEAKEPAVLDMYHQGVDREDIDSVLHWLLHVCNLNHDIDRRLEHFFRIPGPSGQPIHDSISSVAFGSSSDDRLLPPLIPTFPKRIRNPGGLWGKLDPAVEFFQENEGFERYD
ncbi:hypothetical protein BDV96DRAFT_642224 [Lophiotrema nucula]|uniref:NACHT domain-containing protein n=1 Tax=Lophiotrema nucula TaxID=690887 RepID=A0A6A5ZN39_9PLEO|nr:hypothetical protein BDV96DRAFT_642224 [Lophiotrema nucula]